MSLFISITDKNQFDCKIFLLILRIIFTSNSDSILTIMIKKLSCFVVATIAVLIFPVSGK